MRVSEKLAVIGHVASDFGLHATVTCAHRIDLFAGQPDQLPQICQRLVDAGMASGHAYGKSLRTVKSCAGDTWCRFGCRTPSRWPCGGSCATRRQGVLEADLSFSRIKAGRSRCNGTPALRIAVRTSPSAKPTNGITGPRP